MISRGGKLAPRGVDDGGPACEISPTTPGCTDASPWCWQPSKTKENAIVPMRAVVIMIVDARRVTRLESERVQLGVGV